MGIHNFSKLFNNKLNSVVNIIIVKKDIERDDLNKIERKFKKFSFIKNWNRLKKLTKIKFSFFIIKAEIETIINKGRTFRNFTKTSLIDILLNMIKKIIIKKNRKNLFMLLGLVVTTRIVKINKIINFETGFILFKKELFLFLNFIKSK